MKQRKKIGIIGFGNMGGAIALALAAQPRWNVSVYDIDCAKTARIKKIHVCQTAQKLIVSSDVVIIALKPQNIVSFLREHKEAFLTKKALVISIAAGIATSVFERALAKYRIVRVMPNLAAQIQLSVSGICKGRYATMRDMTLVKELFSAIGEVLVVPENFLDKVTSISGSGPGYVYFFMDALYQSARQLGFRDKDARKMVLLTVLGASAVAIHSQKDFAALAKAVASPKGTTEAAFTILKKRQFAKTVNEAVRAAHKRAKTLSVQYGKER